MGGWVDGWMGGWMDGWMDGWMGGWVDGWMDGWMGYDIFPPSILFNFNYDNKLDKPVPKMCLKIVFAIYIRSYEYFKFQMQEF